MFKAIIEWFMVNYEMYLLVGCGFALLHYYRVKKELASRNKYFHEYDLSKRFPFLVVLRIPFYPVFIIMDLLDVLASWE